MNTHADKTTETKSNAASNGVTVQQSAGQQLTDNRPEAIAQRKIQEAANNSQHAKQLKAVKAFVNNSPQVKQLRAVQAMTQHSPSTPVVQMVINATNYHYINTALAADAARAARLTALGLAHTYTACLARLTAAEKAIIEGIWTVTTSGKKRAAAVRSRKTAGELIAAELDRLMPLTNNVFAYANSFDTKHTCAGDATNAEAVRTGNARAHKPPFHTVFRKAHLETFLAGLAGAQGTAGVDKELTRAASADGANNIALASLRVASQDYAGAALGMYRYKLVYTIAVSQAARTKTFTASHMDTDA